MNLRTCFLAVLAAFAPAAFAQTASTDCSFVGNQAICTTTSGAEQSAAISNLLNAPLEMQQHPPQNAQLTNALNKLIAKYRESRSEDNSQAPGTQAPSGDNSQAPSSEDQAPESAAPPSDSAVELSQTILTQDLKTAPDLATAYRNAAKELHQLSDILNNPRLDQIATSFSDQARDLSKAQDGKANP